MLIHKEDLSERLTIAVNNSMSSEALYGAYCFNIVNYTVWCTIPLILSHCPIKSFLINSASLSYWSISYRRVEAQVANVAGDNLFFLERLRDTKCVVDHCLLDGVHLRVRKKRVQSKQHAIWFSQIKDICAAEAFPKEIMWQKKCHLKYRGFQTVSPSA